MGFGPRIRFMERRAYSRPARLGALVADLPEETILGLLSKKRILARLETMFSEDPDARETFVFTVNQVLRYCPNVSICVDKSANDLIETCRHLAYRVHGSERVVDVVRDDIRTGFDATVNVGMEVREEENSATVNSNGWIARLAAGQQGKRFLEHKPSGFNPIGALAAGCLGAGAAFLATLGKPIVASTEMSLFTYEVGSFGTLDAGPALPDLALRLNAFLVGCGAVANGWAYAVKRLPIIGALQAIDRQSLRIENVGPYVAAGRDSVGKRKAELIKALLSPKIEVTARADQWEFFKIRLKNELSIPPLIITGLDNVVTRHSVQRLWPETLIDMAAGGLGSQVIVKHRNSDGQCILNALRIPNSEADWARDLASTAGLNPHLIASDPTGEITQEEIDKAPVDKQFDLQS